MGVSLYDKSAGSKRLEAKYILNTAKGIEKLLEDAYGLQSIAYMRSDFSAIDILLDLATAIEIAKLTDKQKVVLELIYVKGFTQEETAKMVGVSGRTVSFHKQGALEKLASIFATWEYN